MANEILKEAGAMQGELSAWRRYLHQNPELGMKLPQTVAYVTAELGKMGISYEVYEDCSCVVALLGSGEKCILLRADMDALPITEESGEPFASTNGCMHGCGHDCHAASLLGAAKILKAHESELKGTVKLLFQSGEETFNGAAAAIAHGVLENPKVDVAFATHMASVCPVGVLAYGKCSMSSVYGFKIQIQGKGCHGSMPESGIDPINAGVHIYLALQELIAREISASDEAALTIGHFEGGKAANVIPDGTVLEGTLRTFKPEIREYLIRRIQEVIESVAATYRTTVTIEELSNVPPLVSDDGMIDLVHDSIKKLDEQIYIMPDMHGMGSEDFAFFSEKVPSMYCMVGAAVSEKDNVSHHNPKTRFNEKGLPMAAALYAQVALDWLEKNN